MRKVSVIGVGMHPFGKFLDKGLQDLSRVGIWNAIEDAGVSPKDIEVAHVGNSLAFFVTGQKGVRGQVVLRDAGLGGIPIVDAENACASGTTAFRGLGLRLLPACTTLPRFRGGKATFAWDCGLYKDFEC